MTTIGTNWRSPTGRISYRPDWDSKQSYITYDRNGTAKKHFATLSEAMKYLGLSRPSTWK